MSTSHQNPTHSGTFRRFRSKPGIAALLTSALCLVGAVGTWTTPAQAAAPSGSEVIPDAPPGWSGVRVGSLGGGVSAIAEGKQALNACGQVVGRSTTADGRTHAFIWDRRNGMTDLTPDADWATATSVNDRGTVVGTIRGPEWTWTSFIWDARRGLRTLDISPQDINTKGEVVGGADYLWSPTRGRVSFGAPEGTVVTGFDINDRSQVTGVYYYQNPDRGSQWRAFFWDPASGWHDLVPEEATISMAFDLNSRGTVFGTLNRDGREVPFQWDVGHGLVELDFGGALLSSSEGINDRGDAVLWNGLVRDRQGLITQIASEGRVVHAEAINNRGTVAGQLLTGLGTRAFVWTEREGVADLGPADGPFQYSYDTVFVNNRDQVAFTSGDQVALWSRR